MKLYYGSYLAVPHPDLKHSRQNVDFGPGFYTTPIYQQALKWCQRIKRLRYEKPNLQDCFRTAQALKHLHFLRSEQV